MITKTKNLIRQISVNTLIFFTVTLSMAQGNGYLTNRVKMGDIFYVDGFGDEHFIDYRLWDQSNPPGTALGVVSYAYYGPLRYDPSSPPAWHGWIVETGSSEPCAWAPVNTLCYNNTVADYEVEGINTPWNPSGNPNLNAILDTCGWQNTRRFLEFVYTGHSRTLSTAISPAFYYVFSQKNGVSDFSTIPPMDKDCWYLPSLGQIRALYGAAGYVNAALHACGGVMLMGQDWFSSTEIGITNLVWGIMDTGASTVDEYRSKDRSRYIRAFRNF